MIHKLFLIVLIFSLTACDVRSTFRPTDIPPSTPTLTATASATPSPGVTATVTASVSPTLTASPTSTLTPTITLTPTVTQTATITPTATPDYPDVTVKMQANCRYGPGVAYLYRWGLYPGDKAEVRGRNWNGSWYWIHPANLEPRQNCWASEIVFEERIDNALVPVVQVPLPKTTFAGPPGDVTTVRSGSEVNISWSPVILSEDKTRGYLLELYLCQNGVYFFRAYTTLDNTYTVIDEPGCGQPSGGLLYTAEKHGYSDPVELDWP